MNNLKKINDNMRGYRKNVRLVVSSWGCDVLSIHCHTWHEQGWLTFHCHWYSSTVGGLVFFIGLVSESPCSPSSHSPSSSGFSASGRSGLSPSARSPSTAMSSNSSNSNRVEGSPNSFTAGNPVLSDFNFNVNRGPISCNAAFSVDRKAYLNSPGSASFQQREGGHETNLWRLKNKKSR